MGSDYFGYGVVHRPVPEWMNKNSEEDRENSEMVYIL